MASVVNLDKKIEESSPGMPLVNDPKSMAGNERRHILMTLMMHKITYGANLTGLYARNTNLE